MLGLAKLGYEICHKTLMKALPMEALPVREINCENAVSGIFLLCTSCILKVKIFT